MKKKFILITPIWKSEFNFIEKYYLEETILNTKNIEKIFLHGDKMNISWYKKNYPEWKFAAFKNTYFKNKSEYSKLMLKYEFYELFEGFENIIICQTDAVIVKNINNIQIQSYDYIGSPWRKGIRVFEFKDQVFAGGLLNLIPFLKIIYVGNGGLSIRKVKKFMEVTQKIDVSRIKINEDVFISLKGKRYGIRIPSKNQARKYFMEQEISEKSIKQVYGFHAPHKWSDLAIDHISKFHKHGK